MRRVFFSVKKVFFIVSLLVIGTTPVLAQKGQHISPRDMLEFSMTNLKQSALEIAQRNQWLLRENETFQVQGAGLKKELEELSEMKTKLLYGRKERGYDELSEEADFVDPQERKEGQIESLPDFSKTKASMEERVSLRIEETVDLESEIVKLQEQVLDYQKKLQELDQVLDKGHHKKRKQEMAQVIKESGKKIALMQKDLYRLESQHKKPLFRLKELEGEKKAFTKQKKKLQNYLDVEIEKQKNIKEELKGLKGEQEKDKAKLLQDIEELELRKKELKETFSLADEKLKKSYIDIKVIQMKESQLMENLSVVEQENEVLLKEYSALEKKLKSVEN